MSETTYATKHVDLFATLAMPFQKDQIKQRSQGGRTLFYITARMAQNRLDEAVGPENWTVEYRETQRGVVATVSIRINGEWVAKSDGGGYAGMEVKNRQGEYEIDEENDVKTAYSDSFKRACVVWGIGRYLYNDGVPDFVAPAFGDRSDIFPAIQSSGGYQGGNSGGQRSPSPPPRQGVENHRPSQDDRRAAASFEPSGNRGGGQRPPSRDAYDFGDMSRMPSDGRGLFRWAKDKEEKEGFPDVLKTINGIAKRFNLQGRTVDWSSADVVKVWDVLTGNDRQHPVNAHAGNGRNHDGGSANDPADEGEVPF